MVAQVRLDLELDVVAEIQFTVTQLASELVGHRVIGKIGDVSQHARKPQAARRHDAVLVEIAAVEFGVGQDGATSHVVERDVLGGEVRCGGDSQHMRHAVWIRQRPLHRLHAAQAAADDSGETLDAELIGQACLCIDPVFYGDHREGRAIGFARGRGYAGRAGRTMTATEIVQPDDEEFEGVDGLARPHHVVPPADVLGVVCVVTRDVVMSRQRVADEDGVGLIGIQCAVGLIHQLIT